MSKVVSLHGAPIGGIGNEPDQMVIDMLEDLLERAKVGDVQALAYAHVAPGGAVANGWEGTGASVHSLGFAVSVLHHRYYSGLHDVE